MSPSYHIAEPHPSVTKSQVLFSGRGGAGNAGHYSSANITNGTDAQGPASKISLKKAQQSSPYYYAGRGGAGNLQRDRSERAMFSFDEELARQAKMMENQAPVYHVGRGGAGNLVDEMGERRRASHSSSGSTDSANSIRQSFDGALSKIRGSFSRHA